MKKIKFPRVEFNKDFVKAFFDLYDIPVKVKTKLTGRIYAVQLDLDKIDTDNIPIEDSFEKDTYDNIKVLLKKGIQEIKETSDSSEISFYNDGYVFVHGNDVVEKFVDNLIYSRKIYYNHYYTKMYCDRKITQLLNGFSTLQRDWRDICERNEGMAINYKNVDEKMYYDSFYQKFLDQYYKHKYSKEEQANIQ